MTFIPRFRGALAVLSFVVLVVARAYAVPATQDFTYTGSKSAYGSAANVGVTTTWVPIAPPDTISSLTLDLTFSAHVSAYNANPFSSAQNWNVFIDWAPSVYVFLPDGSISSLLEPDQMLSKSGVVAASGMISIDGDFTDTIHLTFYSPSLIGSNSLKFLITSGAKTGTQFGSATQDATITGHLTYNVPEVASTLGLLVPALAAVFVVRHRMRNRRALVS